VAALETFGTGGTRNGAAGYHEWATGSKVDANQRPLFIQIFKGRQTP